MSFSLLRGLAAASVLVAACGAHAASYGTNLITNGDAESTTAGWSSYDGTPLFQSVEYGSNWVLPSQPGPADRGAHLFVGGSGVSYAAGYQVLDLTANAADIGTGLVSYALSGWLGGWSNQGDNAWFGATFLDGQGDTLAYVYHSITPADRSNQTGLLYVASSGYIPAGTTQVVFDLSMERLVSGDNDGYADNLSFSMALAPVPEPETYAMMVAGLLAVAASVRRRRRS